MLKLTCPAPSGFPWPFNAFCESRTQRGRRLQAGRNDIIGNRQSKGNDIVSAGSFLDGIRVIEVADELGEYCGRVLAGLGADVVKIEPPGGDITRTYGPFYEDIPGPERSLYFWQYNLGKRSVELDLDTPEGQASFLQLAKAADVVIDTRPRDWMNTRGLGYLDLARINGRLIYVRVSAFGDDGPWADFKGSDLIHLALG
ncbi:CoA transferase, partial [Mesorhizobium sp. M1338]|uniref:CoA transferase n=1 Tax=Mesorhizobium sp. M1338 TaxID=2957085 RepID=UPI00333775AA